jgi:hypothetical protein
MPSPKPTQFRIKRRSTKIVLISRRAGRRDEAVTFGYFCEAFAPFQFPPRYPLVRRVMEYLKANDARDQERERARQRVPEREIDHYDTGCD